MINTVVPYKVFLQVKMLRKATVDSVGHCEYSRLQEPPRVRGHHEFQFFFSNGNRKKHSEKHKSKNIEFHC
jgi:hypothetical protein